MRNSLFLVLSVGLVSLGVGCGDSGSSSGSGGGGTGGGGTGGSTTTTGVTNSTTTGGMDCTGVLGDPTDACFTCIEGSCCAELDACLGDTNCSGCLSGSGTSCDTDPLLADVSTCLDASCSAECGAPGECARFCCTDGDCGTGVCDKDLTGDANVGICVATAMMTPPACDAPATSPSNGSCVTLGGAYACNPITNEGCDTAAGEACDFDGSGGFTCYPDGNTEAVCAACDAINGPFCASGHTCVPQ